MNDNSKKSNPPYIPIPLQDLSPEEIFQFLRANPGSLSHQAKVNEKVFCEAFFNFFLDYFYMEESVDLKDFLNSLERAILVKMLDKFNGNQKDTAAFLGMNHTTLNQKVRRHKIHFDKRLIEG